MEKLGHNDQLVAAPGDIGTVAGCQLVVKTAVDALGGLDILVNSAGIGAGRPIADCDEKMWDDHLNVNLKGLFFVCQAAVPELRKSEGNIVNISSDAGLIGVRVNCVCPGYVDTDMIRLSAKRKPDPEAAWQKMIDSDPHTPSIYCVSKPVSIRINSPTAINIQGRAFAAIGKSLLALAGRMSKKKAVKPSTIAAAVAPDNAAG